MLGQDVDFDQPMAASFNLRSGDILYPEMTFKKPIRVEAEHFIDCIFNLRQPLTGLDHARAVVSILERGASFQCE